VLYDRHISLHSSLKSYVKRNRDSSVV
jgi:hypothetical protein